MIAVITFAKWSNTQLPGNCNSHHEKPLQASALNPAKFIWEILKQHVRECPPPPPSKHHIRENRLGRTAFHPCCRVSEKWKIKAHWSCSGSLWWPNTFKFKQVSPLSICTCPIIYLYCLHTCIISTFLISWGLIRLIRSPSKSSKCASVSQLGCMTSMSNESRMEPKKKPLKNNKGKMVRSMCVAVNVCVKSHLRLFDSFKVQLYEIVKQCASLDDVCILITGHQIMTGTTTQK